MPKFFESLKKDAEKDPELAAILKESLGMAERNTYIRKAAEALMSDQAAALAAIHDVIVEAAVPALVGREVISVVPTQSKGLRFFMAKGGKANVTAELSEVWDSPETYTTKDIDANIIVRSGALWSRSFIEDFEWPVMQRQATERARSIGELETSRIISLYDGIAAGNLAGGAEVTEQGTAMVWADVVNLWAAVNGENRNANVLLLPPNRVADLWKDDKFIHAFYFGDEADVRRGVLGDVYLGMRVVQSSLVGSNKAYAIDTSVAAALVVRRDITTEPVEDPVKDQYGIVASERIGLGTLDTKGVSRITW